MDKKNEDSLEKSIADAKHEQEYILNLANGLTRLKNIFYRTETKQEIKQHVKTLNDNYIDSLEENKRLKDTLIQNNKAMHILIHDISSPLANVIQLSSLVIEEYAQLVSNDPKFNEAYQLLKLLQNNSEVTLKTINLYKDWINSNEKGFTLNCKNYNMAEIISECCTDLKFKAQNKGIILKYGDDSQNNSGNEEEKLNVFTDKNLIYITLNNLVSNSIKFTPSEKNIYVTAEISDNDYVKVTVKDEGMGIPLEIRDNLFEEKGYTSKGTNGETGTGLGLFTCRELVEKQGGKIGFGQSSNSSYSGAEIYFTVPRHSSSERIIKESLRPKGM